MMSGGVGWRPILLLCVGPSQWPGPHLQCRDPIQWQRTQEVTCLCQLHRCPLVLPKTSGTGIAQLVEHPTKRPGAVLTGFESPVRQGISFSFSPRASFLCNSLTVVKFQCKLQYRVRKAPVCNRVCQQLRAR